MSTDDRIRVSVALCTHNGATFVEQQVRSILAQSHRPTEIVLSDDASTDDTVDLVSAAVAPTDVSLTVIRNTVALGVTKNFEQAVLACSGDLVALSDQDDVWRPDRLELLAARFAAEPDLLLAHSDARLVDADGSPLPESLFDTLEVSRHDLAEIEAGNAFAVLLHRNLVTGATVVFRRSLVAAAAPFPESWLHDEWLASIAAATGRMDVVRDRLIDYRQHGSNEVGASRRTFAQKVARAIEPRGDRNSRLERRALALVERLDSWGNAVPSGIVEGARGKLGHERVRNSLPANRLRRVRPVVSEARAGGYSLYGRGAPDILRDLLQSASPSHSR